MGISVLIAPGSAPIRSMYLEGYGAVFMLNVGFPLLAPPAKPEVPKEKAPVDSTWEEARRELYARPGDIPGVRQIPQRALRFPGTPEPAEEYSEEKVDRLKKALVEALKNATNIRDLNPDDWVNICVFGAPNGTRQGGSAGGGGFGGATGGTGGGSAGWSGGIGGGGVGVSVRHRQWHRSGLTRKEAS